MSTETMERPVAAAPVVALTPQKRAAIALNTAEYEIKLQELLTNSAGILAVKNKAGRDECHTAYMVLKNARCSITNLSEDATEDAKAFTKAVKAEAVRLIAITEKEETRLQTLRDAWDDAEQARKDALLAAEDARKDAIKTDIQSIRDTPLSVVGMCSSSAEAALAILDEIEPNEARFAEFVGEASVAIVDAKDKVLAMHAAALASEAAALAAEEARKAEAARIEQERAALAAQRAENERIANEQAAERRRLADQQAAQERAAKELADKAAANLRAEREALEEAMRLEREKAAKEQAERDRVAADLKRQLDEQQAAIAAERQALIAERQAQEAAHAAALRRNDDHELAIAEKAQFDADRETERQRLQALADEALADARLPRPESCCARDARIDVEVVEVSDNDIINVVMWEFDWSNDEATKRMKAIDYAAAWQERLAEMED